MPRFPAWASELRDVPYSHSMVYRNAKPFEGKRVLVVGGGESGSDVAYEIARSAARCWVSLRETTGWVVPRKRGDVAADVSTHRGLWGLPRTHGERLSRRLIQSERDRRDPVFDVVVELNERIRSRRGVWGTFGTKTLALPWAVARHGCKVVGEVVGVEQGGRRLRTADGVTARRRGRGGVLHRLPEPRRLHARGLARVRSARRSTSTCSIPIFASAWCGSAGRGRASAVSSRSWRCRRASLRWSARAKHELPDPATLQRVVAADREAWFEQFEENARKIRSLVDYHRYMDDLAGLIGCEPPLWSYLVRHPRLWRRMVYGPTQATQFRLRGPGKKIELAHAILAKLPVSRFNHVVKAGLRGRVEHAFGALLPRGRSKRLEETP